MLPGDQPVTRRKAGGKCPSKNLSHSLSYLAAAGSISEIQKANSIACDGKGSSGVQFSADVLHRGTYMAACSML